MLRGGFIIPLIALIAIILGILAFTAGRGQEVAETVVAPTDVVAVPAPNRPGALDVSWRYRQDLSKIAESNRPQQIEMVVRINGEHASFDPPGFEGYRGPDHLYNRRVVGLPCGTMVTVTVLVSATSSEATSAPVQAMTGACAAATTSPPPPSATATLTPTVSPSPTATASPIACALPLIDAMLASAGVDWSPCDTLVADALGDTYNPADASPVSGHSHVDLTGAAAVTIELTAEQAAALSAAPCPEEVATDAPVHASCNFDPGVAGDLLPAGPTALIVSSWAAPLALPVQDGTSCSFAVQTDVAEGGFESSYPYHFLTSGDRYHELIVFGREGATHNFNYSTDLALPPHPDTGGAVGNLASPARAFWWSGGTEMLWVVPAADLGDNWSVGGRCDNGDSVYDRLGAPTDADWPAFQDLAAP